MACTTGLRVSISQAIWLSTHLALSIARRERARRFVRRIEIPVDAISSGGCVWPQELACF